jgi:hypothetical protein
MIFQPQKVRLHSPKIWSLCDITMFLHCELTSYHLNGDCDYQAGGFKINRGPVFVYGLNVLGGFVLQHLHSLTSKMYVP